MRDQSDDLGRRVYRRKFEVKMPTDAEGYAGRNCPKCGQFFKVRPDFDRPDEHLQHCPSCGHLTELASFLTRAQMTYARALASRMGDIADADAVESLIVRVLDSRARRGTPPGEFDAQLRRPIKPPPMPKFREPEIADKYLCPKCQQPYAMEGAPKFCPGCGAPAAPAHKVDGKKTENTRPKKQNNQRRPI